MQHKQTMYITHISFTLFLMLSTLVAEAIEDSVTVFTDTEFFTAICAQKKLIWIGADLDLREENWPTDCAAPVRLVQNMTISGPLNEPIKYQVSFNFMARKIVIPRLGEVRLRQFTARNTRRGGGGEIDFIAYSPRGILWTDDLNKNQIICLHTDPAKLAVLPLPVGFPQFAGKQQDVSLWDTYCTAGAKGRCWQEVLHYQQFFTDVNVGSDTETGGYVMAKSNASKTCDAFVTDECLARNGGDACMAAVINGFLASLPPGRPPKRTASQTLVTAPPAALGITAVLTIFAAVFLWRRKVRQRRHRMAEAEAAATTASTLGDGDVESCGGKGPGSEERGNEGPGTVRSCDDSKEGGSSGGEHPPGDNNNMGIEDSFCYETLDDMGQGLSGGGRPRPGPASAALLSAAAGCTGVGTASGAVLVEGVMDDGSLVSIVVGPSLGQGSYGVVFKGVWQGRAVAVKLILCDRSCSEQVANEVRLMTSPALRHPHLLQAYAVMTKTRLVNKGHPAAQALQSTLNSLTASARARSGNPQAAHPATGGVEDGESWGLQYGSSKRSSGGGGAGELAETWIVSEYCDLGSLAPHVHVAKRFLNIPPCSTTTVTPATNPATNPAITTSTSIAAPSKNAGKSPGPSARNDGDGGVGSTAASGGGGEGVPRLAVVLGCLRDIASGMTHLHSHNIAHGDLKLANVLLCSASSLAACPPSAPHTGPLPHPLPAPSTTTHTSNNSSSSNGSAAVERTTGSILPGHGGAILVDGIPESGGNAEARPGSWEGEPRPETSQLSPPGTPQQTSKQQQQQQQQQDPLRGDPAALHILGCMSSSETAVSPPSLSCSAAATLEAPRQFTSGILATALQPDVVAKVADFGLSRWLKEGQTHHSTKTVGTVTHMPPELLRNGKLTLSGDVYSFGIIMWEILTGSVPYKGLLYGEVVERVVVSHRRPEFPYHTPAAYRSLAERCWAANAADRPPFAVVLSELESLLAAATALQAECDRLAAAAAAT